MKSKIYRITSNEFIVLDKVVSFKIDLRFKSITIWLMDRPSLDVDFNSREETEQKFLELVNLFDEVKNEN